MATRKTKRKRSEGANPDADAGTGTGTDTHSHRELRTGADDGEGSTIVRPSGYPFIDSEVEWVGQRFHLANKPHKVIPGGYESIAGDVNAMLRHIGIEKADLVRKSAMGEFTRLNDLCTKSGNMLHYLVCRQVVPNPNFDPTCLFFKIGDVVLRFSREEYALVSGLKFGPSTFDPYADHDLPENSVFEKLFGAKEETTTADVRTVYIDKEALVKNKKVVPTKDELVKLSKLMLCLGFAMGYDITKKKIPRWIWVLLENETEWESFPWGSISYQYLAKEVKKVKKKMTGRKMNYTLNGNIIAFSAWAFDAIPCFGEKIGHRNDEEEQPRFMRYTYKKGGFPPDEEIMKDLVRKLKPTKNERLTVYWKSLKDDPAPHPFALPYKTGGGKRKRQADGDTDDEEGDDNADSCGNSVKATLTAEQLEQVADAATNKVVKKMTELLQQYQTKAANDAAENRMKQLLQHYHKRLVDDIANTVNNKLLERARQDPAFERGDIWLDPIINTPPFATQDGNTPATPTFGGQQGTSAKRQQVPSGEHHGPSVEQTPLQEPVGEEKSLAGDGEVEHPLVSGEATEPSGHNLEEKKQRRPG